MTSPLPYDRAAADLAREAAAAFESAAERLNARREPGGRQRYREQLILATELAEAAIDAANDAADDAAVGTAPATPFDAAEDQMPHAGDVARRARTTLARALAARADDARYGAGQLSRGSQRAPTVEDCDDGWQRVEAIVADAEAFARRAIRVAQEAGTPAADAAARAARNAAEQARQIVAERNNAYTFHVAPGFSFGEGWYVAAAALLAGIDIQIEPGQRLTPAVEHFIDAAGLRHRVVENRPRPRANKHLTGIVAAEFRRDAAAAQRTVRTAFLGDEPAAAAIVSWARNALADAPIGNKVLLWIRHSGHHPNRNTADDEIAALAALARDCGLVPILFGDALQSPPAPAGTVDFTLCWKEPLFQGPDMRRAQLQLFEHLRRAHGLVGQVGVTTAGMDGPALLGLPTLYITGEPNPRMGAWVGAIPGYREVVRDATYLDRIRDAFDSWR